MFVSTDNIDKAFRGMRFMMAIVVFASLCIAVYSVYTINDLSAKLQDRVYILTNGKAAELLSSSRSENLVVEARDHVSRFHELFFSLDPDEKAIQANIKKALYLSDQSAKKQFDDLIETGYIAGIISGNVSQQIIVDSVIVRQVNEMIGFRCYATLKIIRPSSLVTRSLITQGYLRNVTRSDHNPHGFLIEKWETLENRDLKIESR